MVRRSKVSHRAQLSVTQLEAREVPAGMIDLIYNPGDSIVVIQGDNEDNQVRVEHVAAPEVPLGYQVEVSSESGPIRYFNSLSGETVITEDPIIIPWRPSRDSLFIDTGNGHDTIEVISTARPNPNVFLDWLSVLIVSGKGNDQALLDDVQAQLFVSTGNGADLVTMRNCYGDDVGQLSEASIETGSGDDRVVMLGVNSFLNRFFIGLGAGDDVLEGDSETTLPEAVHPIVGAGDGFDRLLNAAYFHGVPGERPGNFFGFEEIS